MKTESAETSQFIEEHLTDDVHSLALQAAKYPEVDMLFAITQISGRQSIRHKIPSWYAVKGLLYPPHLSLEQCSSEITARYKSAILQGDTLVDLTGGFGVDCAFLSTSFNRVTYVERQKELADIARNNFSLLGLHNITVEHDDGVSFLKRMEPVDCIFIDPARRDRHGHKTVLLPDCEPNVIDIQDLLLGKAKKVMIKLSPMLDLTLALRKLSNVFETYIISRQNECKELLLLLEGNSVGRMPIHCINFTGREIQKFSFTREAESESRCDYAGEPANFLYEPNSSVLKAGAYKSMSSVYGIKKLHPNGHLYTSSELVEEFPGRRFRIREWSAVGDKSLLAGITKANISVRNFPLSAVELRKRLKLTEGGDTYLFATTLMNKKKIIIKCEKV